VLPETLNKLIPFSINSVFLIFFSIEKGKHV
jgi:hypothetical protein